MIVPLPQSGQGWPTKASTPPVAEGVEAIVATGAGEPGKSAFTSFVVFSAFGFFSFGVLGFRSRFLGSFFAFYSAFAATAS